jgi:hemolysin activation/secretion protein
MVTAQYVTSPDHAKEVTIFAAGYRVPFYSAGGSLDVNLSYSSVNSGYLTTAAGSYGISGSGNTLGVRYTHLLQRLGEWDQRVSLGYDYKFFQSNVVPLGENSSIVPELVAQPLTLGYAGFSKADGREWGGSFALVQNLPGGDKNTSSAYQAMGGRSQADASYRIARYNLYLRQAMPGQWQFNLRFNGQETSHALITGEQFGLGGADSVRGFAEREVMNDRGLGASLELVSPDFGKRLGLDDLHCQGLVFYDAGQISRNLALPGETNSAAIASAGLGLRLSYRNRINLRMDYANVRQGAGVRREGDERVHASLTLML